MTVRDNGLGVDPDQATRIFGMFSRADQEVDGVGIGLAVCRRIVEAHGGRIWVESAGPAARSASPSRPDRGQRPDRRPPGRVRGAARARRGEPVHGPRVPPGGRDDPRPPGSRSPTSCGPGACAGCAGSARGSSRGCASWSRPARSPSWPSSSASSRRSSSASAATSGSARGARSRSRRRSACGRSTSSARRRRPGRLQTVPGIGPKTEARLLEALAREADAPQRGLLLNRARELVGGVAAALDGDAGRRRAALARLAASGWRWSAPRRTRPAGALRRAAPDRRRDRAATSGARSA